LVDDGCHDDELMVMMRWQPRRLYKIMAACCCTDWVEMMVGDDELMVGDDVMM